MANNITFRGKTKNHSEWARETGLSVSAFANRVKKYGSRKTLGDLLDGETQTDGDQVAMQPEEKDNVIIDALGDKYVQKKISLDSEPGRELANGSRVRVYNKLNTNLHCTDCILPAQSEGSILESDLNHPSISKNTIVVA